MTRWKYLLLVVALLSRFAALSLNYVSDIADWFWYLWVGCWWALFFLVLSCLFRRRWRELVIISSTLVVVAAPTFRVGEEQIERVQEKLFRTFALHRIQSVSLEEFLSSCKLIDYVEDDGTKGQVGQCNEFRLTPAWSTFSVIYDPTGQFALPAYRRTFRWRWAVEGSRAGSGLNPGSMLTRTDRGVHLVGNFYYIKIFLEDWDGG